MGVIMMLGVGTFLRRSCLLWSIMGVAIGCGGPMAGIGPAETVLRVSEGDVRPRLILTGTLEAVESTRLSVPVNPQGKVQIEWLADDGSEVRRGDPLAELDSSASAAIVDDLRLDALRAIRELDRVRAQSQAEAVRSESAAEQARIDLAKAELDASIPPSVISEFELEQRRLRLDRARAEFDKASTELEVQLTTSARDIEVTEIELDQARRTLREAESAIADLSIAAPRDGIFIIAEDRWEGRKRQVGDSVWIGEPVGIMPILDRIQVRAKLSDVDDGKVRVGAAARCVLDSYPDTVFRGEVAAVNEVAQEPDYMSQRRFFDVIVQLEESDPRVMRPGMSVRVEVPLDSAIGVRIVPRPAIDSLSSPPRIHLGGDRWRDVRLGPCSATHCAVEGDIEVGTVVIPVGVSR